MNRRVLAIRGSAAEHWDEGESDPYEAALRGAGLEPVLVASGEARELLDSVAGVVLLGGVDVNPALYGEVAHEKTEPADLQRDALETAVLSEALRRDLPVLAICRGLQMLNVFLGGSLRQHLEPVERHQSKTAEHVVEIRPGTLLAGIAGAVPGGELRWPVNSRHHQAIARLGDGLVVSAVDAEDGTIEAVELPERKFCLAVQWHPENLWEADEREAGLFRAFAAAL